MLPRGGDARFNFILGVLNGALFQFGTAFLDPTTVMPVFIKNFTGSDFVVGLASAVRRGGWYLPQLPMAGYLEQRPYKRGIYLGANAVRMGLVWLFIPLLMAYGADHPSRALTAFLVIFSISSLSGGLAGSPFIDIVGKTIPPQFRGQFYAIRTFFGAGVLSVLAGFMVQYILGREERFPFPQNYAVLFGLSAGFMSLGIICFGFVREPPGKLSSTRRTALGVIREIPDIFRRDLNYRRLFFTQMLSAGVGFSLPFYVVLAREAFGTSASATGIFLVMQTLGASAATAIWGRVSSRRGNRQVVRLSVMAQAVIPIYALVLGLGFSRALGGAPAWVVMASFAPVFLLIGATLSGAMVGFTSFLLDIAPEDRRPTYIGMTNTAMGFASLFPALGGILADLVHLQAVFVVSAVMVGGSVLLSRRLQEPR